MTEALNKAKSALCEHDGKVSSMRIAMLGVVYVVILTWLGFCIYEGELLDMPGGVVAITVGLVGSKAAQAIFA